MITVGLRFERSAARKLREFEHMRGVNGQLIRTVLRDAERGEPTTVQASSMDEVRQIVAGFVTLGVTPPVIEEQSGVILPPGVFPERNGNGGGGTPGGG